eukprot:Phypoly_transcript_00091.p1 GENE.Phypoly_transcript_00091~~Phypoly_transcript_00091.p1  ORF type:complete len:2307 (+),score=451.47 Phypoly_transcript_00091:133-7053(+)
MASSDHHDALQKILPDLRSRNEDVRVKAAKALRIYVGQQIREMSGENSVKFMNELNGHIFELVNSPGVLEKIGGIMAIDELIDVDYDENATKVTRLANFLRIGIGSTTDTTVMLMASKALGRLARSSGTLTAECVEFEVKRALEWLQERERYEPRRHAAVLVLKELAHNSPTLFYVHVSTFVDLIWVALRDPKKEIRECAAEALRACLELIAERESRMRLQWYQKIYEEAFRGFKSSSPDALHGSLITLGELLRNTGDFVSGKFKDICDIILKYRDHKDRLVKRTVITLLPRLSIYSPDVFVHNYLNTCMNHLLNALRNQADRGVAFIALGEISMSVGGNAKPYLENIVVQIKAAAPGRGKPFYPETLTCVSMLASAVGQALIPHMPSLLQQMFSTGLCVPLIDSLRDLAVSLPNLAHQIQQKLLDLLSQILANKPFSKRLSGTFVNLQQLAPAMDHEHQLVSLALRTLGSFDFSKHNLLEFVRECVVNYLGDTNPEIRRETVITCTKLMSYAGESAPVRGHSSVVVGEVLAKLLVIGIADPYPDIRKTVLTSLDTRFDHQLAQAENLRSLFIALNDEVFEIRELAITVIGRLTTRNPAYVMPSLRKTLIQLLTELEFSGDSRSKEESAKLLCNLIRSSERLIKPYVEPILKALMLKLRDPNPRVSSYVLAALGELAIVGGEDMIPHIGELLPLILDTLQDQSSATKREVALRTLGQLAKSTGYVIAPFHRYPTLLDVLLNIIKGERTPSIRREVIKVLGILGALDPYKHKMNQHVARSKEEQKTDEKGLLVADLTASVAPSSEDYYPTVAIAALMRILRDPTLSAHHTMVVQAVMFIFKSLGLKCVPFLPQIIPPLLHVMNTREPLFREFLFQQLGTLVSIVKQHIRDYLDEIFVLIEKHWNSSMLIPIINLVEEISQALNDEFKVYLPNLIPQVLGVLHTDRSPKRLAAQKVLHALEIFGNNLDDFLHLVIPAIVRLFEQVDTPPNVRILAIQTIGRLGKKLNFADYASRIVHPLSRVLDSGEYFELREEIMQTLCNLVLQMGTDYNVFVPMLAKVLSKYGITHPTYDTLVARLMKNQPLVPEGEAAESAAPAKPDPAVDEAAAQDLGVKKLKVNEQSLKKAWEASQRSTKEDWAEWIRRFSVELLRESPSPALRSCLTLAQDYPPLVRELFNAGFVSCWNELHEQYQDELVHSLETALLSPNIPHEILQILLNLAEFMEHDDKPLPIDISTLGALAEKCHAYAKALHYKETEFHSSPSTCIEALISINNHLQQPEAAVGILLYAQQTHSIELKESWYEKLHRWEDALAAYERKQKDDPTQPEYMLGRMRCLHALGEWERLFQLSKEIWKTNQESTRHAAAPLAAAAAWNMGEWSSMEEYAGALSNESVEGTFFRAILEVHRDNFVMAQKYVDNSRELLDAELAALVGESYNRAYKVVVRIQQLSELEEIVEYKKSRDNLERQGMIRNTWKQRLKGGQQNVEVWQSILAVHSLVIPPQEELDMWLKFIGLCRKGGRLSLAHKTLAMLMGRDPAQHPTGGLPHAHPRVTFAYVKQLWSAGAKNPAFEKLRVFVQAMKTTDDLPLLGRAYLKLGEWQLAMRDTLDEVSIPQIMSSFRSATECDTNWYKAWHAWALINYQVVAYYAHRSTPHETLLPHIVPAVHGFFRSIALSPVHQSLQDTLRLLTLWFKYGAQKDVEAALLDGFHTASIDTWLQVIPQIIARIHTPVQPVRRLIHELLTSIGKEHPQALVYPLTVASKSQNTTRLAAARSIMDKMRKHSANLVDQALMVSQELIRVAIPWNEMWHEGLEEASRLYFGPEHNVEAMLATLLPLHALLDKGPETLREVAFQQAFGRDLQEALDWCKKYTRSGKEADLNQAWDLYYHVFRRISRQLKEMNTVELQFVSPKLLAARDLELAVPGTYRAGEPIVRIAGFSPTLTVFDTKQRPRKLSIHGSNGVEFTFLIKGHEDLRQDERVMQLFGLVNNLLAQDHEIAKSHLSIERYEVIPLSPNSGLIGWVPHSDILHSLIREYRESRKILLNIEHRLMLQMSSDYDNLPLLQKVEIFEYALDSTNGNDLAKVLWLKSRNSEMWLDRRTNYTRSLAVMSMVGYILGLGDRHPRNIMIDKITGRVIHIDFGDCFEVAMHREKYPEKIPFRLTRMLINAMEVSGIEGNFRVTCEAVMGVLRDNHDSLMAVLEAFVYDPLINWRLFTPPADSKKGKMDNDPDHSPDDRTQRPKLNRSEDQDGDTMNEQALAVMDRIAKKLTGRDFNKDEVLDVPAQVQRLIDQATSNENLCQCYIGWCPFW